MDRKTKDWENRLLKEYEQAMIVDRVMNTIRRPEWRILVEDHGFTKSEAKRYLRRRGKVNDGYQRRLP